MELTVGSLFSGIGGIDLGFQQVGFKIVWAVEKDSACCKTYRHNFPSINLIESDIRKIDAKSLSHVNVIAAGFPCQPFSVAGKQLGFQDARGNLFHEIMKFAEVIKPKIIFLENVPNLMEHDNGRTLNIIHNSLVEKGYYIRYKVLRASEYGGVPQIRDRIYLIAFLDIGMCEKFKYPEPTEATTDIYSVLKQNERKHTVYYYNKNDTFYAKASSIVKSKFCIYNIS